MSREDSSSMSMLKHPDSPDSFEGGSSGATAAAATCRTVSPRRFRMSKRALVSTGPIVSSPELLAHLTKALRTSEKRRKTEIAVIHYTKVFRFLVTLIEFSAQQTFWLEWHSSMAGHSVENRGRKLEHCD